MRVNKYTLSLRLDVSAPLLHSAAFCQGNWRWEWTPVEKWSPFVTNETTRQLSLLDSSAIEQPARQGWQGKYTLVGWDVAHERAVLRNVAPGLTR